jgi:hypothetical protein
MSDINPDDLNKFEMPESLLDTIFELSGEGNQHKGFILAFVTQEGKPLVYTRAQNQIIEMGLRKSLEKYLTNLEESESMFGFGDIDPGDSN